MDPLAGEYLEKVIFFGYLTVRKFSSFFIDFKNITFFIIEDVFVHFIRSALINYINIRVQFEEWCQTPVTILQKTCRL